MEVNVKHLKLNPLDKQANLSSKSRIMAGGEGFEPSTPNLGVHAFGNKYSRFRSSLGILQSPIVMELNFDEYKVFLDNKYTNKQYGKAQLSNASKYSDCLENPTKDVMLIQSQKDRTFSRQWCVYPST